MKKVEVLKWAIQHIATNHGFKSLTDDDEEETYSILGNNVPTLSDVQMMCDDLGISREDIYHNDFGIDVQFGEWYYEQGDEEYESSGMEMWKRFGVEIGS